jgi:hypothetical protein
MATAGNAVSFFKIILMIMHIILILIKTFSAGAFAGNRAAFRPEPQALCPMKGENTEGKGE